MTIVTVQGWEVGFQKVAFTKLLQSNLGYGLRQAKDCTDRLMDDLPIELAVDDARVEQLSEAMNALGASTVRAKALVA